MKFNKFLAMLLVATTLTACNTSVPQNQNNQTPNVDPNQPKQQVYKRVTTNLDDFTGEYLIVGNDEYYLNAAALIKKDNCIFNLEANIKNDSIVRLKDGRYSFQITKDLKDTWKITSNTTGEVLGTDKTSFIGANNFYVNTIRIDDDGHAIIKCNGCALRFNNNGYFCYYNNERIPNRISLFKY